MNTMLIVLIIGIFAGFFIQSIIGFAGGLVSLPLLLLIMPLNEAVSYITIFYSISAPIYIVKEWNNIDKKLLKTLAFYSFFGLLLGVFLLKYGQPLLLKRALGLFIILFVLYSLRKNKKISKSSILKPLFGFLGGLFSGVFSTGGPLYVMIVQKETTDIKTFRATMFGILGLVTLMRIPVLVVSGVLTSKEIYNSVFVLPFFLLAIFLGKKVYAKVNDVILKKVIYVLLFVSGTILLISN